MPGFQETFDILLIYSDNLSLGAPDCLRTIVTGDGHILTVNHTEPCAHRLVIGDALGIAALHQTDDGVGQCDGKFLDHLIVADDIHDRRGCDEGDAVERSLGKEHIGNLDDALVSEFLAVEVVADGVSFLVESTFVFKSGMSHTINVILANNPNQVKIEVGGEIIDWNK